MSFSWFSAIEQFLPLVRQTNVNFSDQSSMKYFSNNKVENGVGIFIREIFKNDFSYLRLEKIFINWRYLFENSEKSCSQL